MAAKRKFTLAQEAISTKIVRVRRKHVVLDHHVAELYGVPTREVNRAVKTHPEKFLKGYVIELNTKELSGLRWKNSTANATKRRTPPKAFTEKGDPYFRPDLRIVYRKDKERYSWSLSLDIQNAIARKNIAAINRTFDPDLGEWVFREQSTLTPLLSYQIYF